MHLLGYERLATLRQPYATGHYAKIQQRRIEPSRTTYAAGLSHIRYNILPHVTPHSATYVLNGSALAVEAFSAGGLFCHIAVIAGPPQRHDWVTATPLLYYFHGYEDYLLATTISSLRMRYATYVTAATHYYAHIDTRYC